MAPLDRLVRSAAARGWRWSRLAGYALGGFLLVESAARQVLTLAVALAPNALRAAPASSALPLPPELARRGAARFEAEVGTPPGRLVSWVVEPASGAARGSVVLLHGVRLDRRSLSHLGSTLSDAGYRAILVDLPGHGESSGRFLTYGEREAADISQLLDALAARLPLGCIGVYGYSYGGSVALELGASEPRVRAVVAVAPFASLREVILDYRDHYLPFPLRSIPDAWFESAVDGASQLALFDPDRSAPVRASRRSHAELLLIHGTSDRQVPLHHSLELAQAAGRRARLLTINGASHENLPFEELSRAALEWFGRWLAPAECPAAPAREPGPAAR